MARTCIFTIVSNNYLHFARTLMQGVERYAPEADRLALLCDQRDSAGAEKEPFSILPIAALDIENFEEFVFRYTILELNTAVKPYVFSHLFKQGYDQVIYFDPDIRIYGSLQDMETLVGQYNIVLVPHLTNILDDASRPNELDILRAGAYNLGYIAISNTQESNRFLSWWRRHLRENCVNDQSRGLFVDQRWMDLVPGMFENVYIQKHPGWNAAYWNLYFRKIERQGSEYQVNGEPLVFFHFSGYRPKEKIFSIHQDRYSYSGLPPVVKELADSYASILESNNHDLVSEIEYTFSKFRNGEKIPDIMRIAYRELLAKEGEPLRFTMDEPPQWLIDGLNKPAKIQGKTSPFVTVLGYEVYRLRVELQQIFPDITGRDAIDYGDWYVRAAGREYGLSERFIAGVRRALTDAIANPAANSQLSIGHRIYLYYMQTTKFKRLVKRLANAKTRDYIKQKLIHHVGEVRENDTPKYIPAKRSGGLNVIGYLHAESGTGEAARSTLRAASAVGIEVAGIDVRINNVSRMAETPIAPTVNNPVHGINVFHINADQTPAVLEALGPSYYKNRYNIGFWFWELEEFPDQFQAAFKYLDEIWVASKFCQDAISRKSTIPVIRVPLCIDLSIPKAISRQDIGLPEDSFLVLTIMDMLSIPERKNPIGAIEAFALFAQEVKQGSYLVLKLSNFDRCDQETKEKINRACVKLPIILLDKYLDRQHLTALMNVCDCYLSMHRSEGFGLPIAEFMSLGKPVVATGWSSNMDFMTPFNSMPVNYHLVELQQDHGPYKKGLFWADPDIEHAANSLLKLATDSDYSDKLGAIAKQDIKRYFSPYAVGRVLKDRLDAFLVPRR